MKIPRLCENFSELNPVQIIGGEQTLFAVTGDGKVSKIYFVTLLHSTHRGGAKAEIIGKTDQLSKV